MKETLESVLEMLKKPGEVMDRRDVRPGDIPAEDADLLTSVIQGIGADCWRGDG